MCLMCIIHRHSTCQSGTHVCVCVFFVVFLMLMMFDHFLIFLAIMLRFSFWSWRILDGRFNRLELIDSVADALVVGLKLSRVISSFVELSRIKLSRQAHVVKLRSKHSESTENLHELTWCRWCKPYILRTPGWAPRRLFEALSGSTLYDFIMTFNGHLCHLPLLSNRTRNTKELAHLGSLSCKVLDHVENQIIRQCKLHASALMLMSRTYETLRTDRGPPYLLMAYSPNK